MSRRKIFNIVLVLEALICIWISAMWKGNYIVNIFKILSSPFELLGDGLRQLSWSGTVGNVIAIIIYVLVCTMPTMIALVYIKTKKAKIEETILIFLSMLLFGGVYLFINPSKIMRIEGIVSLSSYKESISITIYSVMVVYIVIKGIRALENTKENKLILALKGICSLVLVFLIASICLHGVSSLLANIDKAIENNQYISNTCVLLVIRFIVEQLPNICMVIIINKLSNVAGYMREEFFDENVLSEMRGIFKTCKISVNVILLSVMVLNVVQLLTTALVSITDYDLIFPIFEILFIAVLMVIIKMISESKKMKDYNDMFI